MQQSTRLISNRSRHLILPPFKLVDTPLNLLLHRQTRKGLHRLCTSAITHISPVRIRTLHTSTMAFSSLSGMLGYETIPDHVKTKSFYDLKATLPGGKEFDFVSSPWQSVHCIADGPSGPDQGQACPDRQHGQQVVSCDR